MPLVELKIEGMSCGHCSASVEEVLSEVDGVEAVSVDLDAGMATVEADAQIAVAKLVASVERAGYDASVV